MDGSFLRREWGAVTFVLTVAVGAIVVPFALWLHGTSTAVANVSYPTASPTVSASPAGAATAPRTTTPTP